MHDLLSCSALVIFALKLISPVGLSYGKAPNSFPDTDLTTKKIVYGYKKNKKYRNSIIVGSYCHPDIGTRPSCPSGSGRQTQLNCRHHSV